MRLVGYCTGCRRFRYVRVAGHDLARSFGAKGVVQGICHDCEKEGRR